MRYLLLLFASLAIACNPLATDQATETTGTQEADVNQLLLKDHKPVSLYKNQQTSISKAKFPVIDMHSHTYARSLEELDAWVETMDRVGIDKTVLLTYETGPRFDSLMQVYARHEGRFLLFCGFDYTGYDEPGFGPAAVKELERCVAAGAVGVGELGDKGSGLFYSRPTKAYGMHVNDTRMKPLLEKCAELNIPINIHVAEPLWMYHPMDETNDGLMNAFRWRLDDKEGIVDHAGMLEILEDAVAQNPKTTFIACHYGNCSYDLSIVGNMLDKYPNLYLDNSARYAETATIPRTVNKFYSRYADRILYGTDMGRNESMYLTTFRIMETEDEHFYDRGISGYHWPMNGYGLGDEVLKKVYYDNAKKMLGL
ncbi:MAG: amidohydrolase [Lunatimonas sp.]|uniref:amidohydrolase family protein n=1 Tax=Lunatimonas sp. TaxID=2060141 RepID=UPI00263AB6ED|nr:amidohydrolase family protein [Lunatimonas sp.]MCC5936518.1 amidohydrolase [Lunatimonas sp.]